VTWERYPEWLDFNSWLIAAWCAPLFALPGFDLPVRGFGHSLSPGATKQQEKPPVDLRVEELLSPLATCGAKVVVSSIVCPPHFRARLARWSQPMICPFWVVAA